VADEERFKDEAVDCAAEASCWADCETSFLGLGSVSGRRQRHRGSQRHQRRGRDLDETAGRSVRTSRSSGTPLAGLVLEGWAFDPHDAQRAVRAVGGAFEGVRTLQPLVQMGVSSACVREGDRKE
jgi:hypothetical protein